MTPDGGILSVPAEAEAAVRALGVEPDALIRSVPAALGRPGAVLGRGAFRWSEDPARLADAGGWIARSHPRLPQWVHPLHGDVLVAWDEDGSYAGGGGRQPNH